MTRSKEHKTIWIGYVCRGGASCGRLWAAQSQHKGACTCGRNLHGVPMERGELGSPGR